METYPASILIIDDHALFRSGLKLVLTADLADVNIIEASSIDEAINNTLTEPNLVLLDIELNGLSGLDGIEMLKCAWPQVAVVMLSSDTSSTTAQLALTRGATAFVTKAETAKKILSLVQNIIGKQFTAHEKAPTITQPSNDNAQQLTVRQSEVLDLLSKGLSNKVIARELNCAENTVRGHVQAILVFFNAASRSEAVYAAKQHGIIR